MIRYICLHEYGEILRDIWKVIAIKVHDGYAATVLGVTPTAIELLKGHCGHDGVLVITTITFRSLLEL